MIQFDQQKKSIKITTIFPSLVTKNPRKGNKGENAKVIGDYGTNLSNAESESEELDFLSNGFKIRTGSSAVNTSGGTYIYMAFAEHPFVSSEGVPVTAR